VPTSVGGPKITSFAFVRVLVSATIVCAAAGCGVGSEVDDTGAAHEPIVNGTEVVTDFVGTPLFKNSVAPQTCSSSLLRDRWLITAFHCVSIDGGRYTPPAPANAFTAQVGSTTVSGVELFYPGQPSQQATIDVALVKLSGALPAPAGHAEPWSGWVTQDTFVSSVVLSGNRIGIVKNNRFYVKEGALSSSWVEIAQDVQQGLLSGTRIGYRKTGGTFG